MLTWVPQAASSDHGNQILVDLGLGGQILVDLGLGGQILVDLGLGVQILGDFWGSWRVGDLPNYFELSSKSKSR